MKFLLQKFLKPQNVAFLIVILLIIFFFPVSNIFITPDGLWYLSTASNIFHGKGYTEVNGKDVITRPPLFQLILTFFFKLFGESLFAAILVLRTFWAVIGLLFFLVTKRLFNWKIALAAFLLMLTMPRMYLLSNHLLLDYPFSFFVLSFLLLALLVLGRKNNYPFYALMGLIEGIGFLFKETMILFLLFPFFLLFLKKEPWHVRIKEITIYLGIFFLLFSAWVIYAFLNTQDPLSGLYFIGGHIISLLRQKVLGGSVSLPLNSMNEFSFFLYAINRMLIFSLFGAVSWLYFFYRTFRKKDKKSLLLIILCLLYLPLILFLALQGEAGIEKINMGAFSRELNGFSFATIIVFVVSVYDVIKYLYKKVAKNFSFSIIQRNLIPDAVFLSSIIFLSTLMILEVPFFFQVNIISNAWSGWYLERGIEEGIGFLSREDIRWAKKIASIVPEGSTIMTSPASAFMLNFLYPEHYFYTLPPALYLSDNLPPFEYYPYTYVNTYVFGKQKEKKEKKILFVWVSTLRRSDFRYITQEDLLKTIKEHSVQYIITFSYRNHLAFLSYYLEKNPGFKKIFGDKDKSLKIFQVKEIQPVKKFTPLFSEDARRFILESYEKGIKTGIFSDFQNNFNWTKEYVYELVKNQKIRFKY